MKIAWTVLYFVLCGVMGYLFGRWNIDHPRRAIILVALFMLVLLSSHIVLG